MQNLMQRTEAALAKQSNYKGQRDTSADQPPAGGGIGPGMGFPGLGLPGTEDSFMQAMMGMLGGGGGGALPDFGQLMNGGEPTEMMLSLILNKTALYEPMKVCLHLEHAGWCETLLLFWLASRLPVSQASLFFISVSMCVCCVGFWLCLCVHASLCVRV